MNSIKGCVGKSTLCLNIGRRGEPFRTTLWQEAPSSPNKPVAQPIA